MRGARLGGQITAAMGPARDAGIRVGDRLLAVDGRRLRDVIDFRFYADGPQASFRIARGDAEWDIPVERLEGSDWGLEFGEPFFDRVRLCANRCVFCFLDQMPPGWRKTLYLRDDDYRLSFLFGNFVTLTNLRASDWARLEEQRLSPLYVSVHATEPELRRLLLGRDHLPDIRRQLARLGRLGISVHAQVVLCPGVNDGVHLERTIADLSRLQRTVVSVALVPVGLTRFRSAPPAGLNGGAARLRPYTPEEAVALLRWAGPRQRGFRRDLGKTFLYLSDEFYLLAGRNVPSARLYDGFPQLENGVGLVRQLQEDWSRARRRLPAVLSRPVHVSFVCGTLIAPLLQRLGKDLSARVKGLTVEIFPLENRTFGPTVTVSGLLTGEVLRESLRGKDLGDAVFLPRAAFDEQGVYTLDDVSLETLREELRRPVFLVDRLSQVVRALRDHK